MTRTREIFRMSGSNTSVVTKNSSWVGMYRVRMTELNSESYGPCNVLSIGNSSNQEAMVRFGFNIEDGLPTLPLKANSVKNINFEDGKVFYGFDVMNLNAATDIAAGSLVWTMARVIDLDNPSLSDVQYISGVRRI